MFKFKIFEIPDGKSSKTLELSPDSIDLDNVSLKEGNIEVQFERGLHFIRVQLEIDILVELICDRSLDEFDYNVNQDYEILFKSEEVEESADENGSVRNINIAEQLIDIEQDVMDTILVSLPQKKLHPRFLDEDGKPTEFLNEKFGEPAEGEQEESIDPRWEALKELKK